MAGQPLPFAFGQPTEQDWEKVGAQPSDHFQIYKWMTLEEHEAFYEEAFRNFYHKHPYTQASGIPFEALKPLIAGAVREFMSVNYLRAPFHQTLERNSPSLGVPTDLDLPYILGKPVQKHAAETGVMEPVDIYIRPLTIEAGWIRRLNNLQEYCWQPMVAGINKVDPTVLVAAPCFLEAVVTRMRSSRIRNGIRKLRWFCTYGFVTRAAEVNVANGKKCLFNFSLTAQGHLGDPILRHYTVTLQEPADQAASRWTRIDPDSESFQAPKGLRCAVLDCAIRKHTHDQQTEDHPELYLRLIFDRDIALWQDEYPESEFSPVARPPAQSVQPFQF